MVERERNETGFILYETGLDPVLNLGYMEGCTEHSVESVYENETGIFPDSVSENAPCGPLGRQQIASYLWPKHSRLEASSELAAQLTGGVEELDEKRPE